MFYAKMTLIRGGTAECDHNREMLWNQCESWISFPSIISFDVCEMKEWMSSFVLGANIWAARALAPLFRALLPDREGKLYQLDMLNESHGGGRKYLQCEKSEFQI